jgi:hypothetical protein
MRMRHIVICGLPGSTLFFHIIPQTTDLRKGKVNEPKIYALILTKTCG